MTMEISMTELRLSDTDVHVAVINSVAVTFGEHEPEMREYDPFRKCATGLCRTQHDKAMTQHDTHLRGEWHPRCSVRCEIITL